MADPDRPDETLGPSQLPTIPGGEPITEYCDRQRLPTRERLDLFTRVCEGVQHAHQKGVIHRDLKPSNVLVRVRRRPCGALRPARR